MRPHPPSAEAGIGSGWSRPQWHLPSLNPPRWRGLSAPMRLLALAATVLVGAVGFALAEGWVHPDLTGAKSAAPGTAFLGTTTCADWQQASIAERMQTTGALGVAATAPNPENRGATMSQDRAYAVFQQACSTRLSRTVLLYEIYNRAASFEAVNQDGAFSGALGH